MTFICDKTKCIGNCMEHREPSGASAGYISYSEWLHYQQPKTPDLREAFDAGRAAGIAWAEPATAELCLAICKQYSDQPAGYAFSKIKEKFGLEI